MGFRDFLAATRPELALPQRCHPARLMDPSVAEELQALAYGVGDYVLAWQDYLGCGGFRERWLSTNALAPWGGPINVTCWPGCGRMSIPMPTGIGAPTAGRLE
jgi:hypothetical protein